MSNIIVHRVEDIAKRHIARIAQIEAMPPQLTRGDFNFWDLNRIGYQRGFVPMRRGRGDKPDLLDSDQGDGAAMPFVDQSGADACPDELSVNISIETTGGAIPAQRMIASSSRPIPWRFKIMHAQMRAGTFSTNQRASFNLIIGNDNHDNSILSAVPSGQRLWEQAGSPNVGFVGAVYIGPLATTSSSNMPDDASGGGPYPAGARLIFVLFTNSTIVSDVQIDMSVRVRRCRDAVAAIGDGGGGGGDGGGGPAPPGGGGGGVPLPTPPWEEVF